MNVHELATPALVIDADAFDRNLATMAAVHPGRRLRPHVKAHKCTSLAAAQQAVGHTTFTCATPREVVGMAAAGVGDELLLANETIDADRLRAMAECGTPVLVAVDSDETVAAAAAGGISAVLIDVNVGLPRCGVSPDGAGALADRARAAGLEVRGVMGYEGHLMMVPDREEQRAQVEASMELLVAAHADVGGDIISAGGTGTFDLHDATGVNEVQAGSYAVMDTHYGTQGLPFEQALHVIGTVISVNARLGGCRRRPQVARHGSRQPRRRRRQGVVLLRRAPHVRSGIARAGRRPHPGRPGSRRPHDGDARAGLAHPRRRGGRPLADRPPRLVTVHLGSDPR